jgi:hypothetical protein
MKDDYINKNLAKEQIILSSLGDQPKTLFKGMVKEVTIRKYFFFSPFSDLFTTVLSPELYHQMTFNLLHTKLISTQK